MPLAVLAQAISHYLPPAGQEAGAAGAGLLEAGAAGVGAVGGILGDMFRG